VVPADEHPPFEADLHSRITNMPKSPIPTPNQSTAPIIDSQISLDGPVADADGSSVATLTGFTREAIAINEPAFGPAKVALVSSASSAMTIPSDGQSQAMKRFAVELLVCPGQFAGDPVRLIESQSTPFSLSLEVGSAGKYSLVGSMHLHHSPQASATTGWSRVVAKDVARVGDWLTVAMVWDGDAMSLFVDGKIVARRVFRDSEIVFLASIASTHFFVGTWVDGKRNRFVGKIAGIRVWNTVASKYTAALTTAEATGFGAIASRHEDLGGDAGSLGVAKSGEQTMGTGRWQMFTNGAIAWRADTGARVIPAPMHTIYNAQRARDSLGFPIQDEGSRGNTRALYFEKGAIFHSNATGAGAVWGPAYLRHVTLTNVLGLPKSAMPTGNAQNPDMITQFERGRIYQAAHTGAFEVHGLIHEHYLALGGPTGMLGLPVSDEEPVRNAAGAEIGRVSSFEKGSIYFSGPTGAHEVHGMILDAYRKLGGPAGELGFPITDERNAANGIAYSAFQNGVLVWRGGWTSAKAIREYEVFVENAHQASGIDDGDESTGEFYAKVRIEANGQVIANQRFPKSGKSNGNVNIASTWSVPIRHDTTIYLKVDVWDWDSASADDYHGRIEQRYDINTLWGTLNADPKLDGDVGIWNNQPLTTKTADTPKLTSIQFNYRISSKATKVSPSKFREQGWWKFENFSTPVLSKDLFTQTFRDVDQVTNTWETILNPLDAAFYEYAFKGAASGGNCFGMSTEAFRALQGHSQFPQQIYRFEKAQAEKHINIKQASQLSANMFHWTVRNVKNLDLIEPIDVFETARKEIDARGACIISMMNLANGTGHAVLAYRYEMGGPNNRYGCLFVADPNLPWPRGNAAHPTYIEVFKNNSFSATTIKTGNNPNGFSSAPIDLGITSLPTTMIMPVPYRVVSGVPRSMIWEVVATALTLGVYLIFAGDATTEQVNVAGSDLYGTNRAIKRNHPLVPVALLDHDAPPTLLTGTSRLTGPTSFDLRGIKQGSYRHAAVLGAAGYELSNPVAAGARDKLSVESPNSAFPLLSFDVDSAAAKSAQLEYFVARDPNNRPARSFSLQLQQAKGDVARIGIDARGGALMVSPGGAPKPFDIHYSIVDAGGQVRRNVLRGVTPSSGPEALRIVADDWMNPQGNFAIERLSSLTGGVLERKTLKGT
jgi:hypothetical protein